MPALKLHSMTSAELAIAATTYFIHKYEDDSFLLNQEMLDEIAKRGIDFDLPMNSEWLEIRVTTPDTTNE